MSRVAARGDLRQHLDDRDLGADRGEETGELQPDVAAADDGDLGGQRRQARTPSGVEHARSESSPGMGGTAGLEPVAIRMFLAG